MCLAGFFQHADVRLLQAFKMNSFVKIVKDIESVIFSKKLWHVWQSPEFVSGSTNLLIRPIVAFNIVHNSFFSELLFVFLLIILFTFFTFIYFQHIFFHWQKVSLYNKIPLLIVSKGCLGKQFTNRFLGTSSTNGSLENVLCSKRILIIVQ